ncbi:hypothetical protein N0Y54_31460, partial [Nostoc punctiforme UO1]|uniref:hypothetical protein n=1 Tax=Nostoc punctiforme TaxID=272131 RepID=UPI0030A4EB31
PGVSNDITHLPPVRMAGFRRRPRPHRPQRPNPLRRHPVPIPPVRNQRRLRQSPPRRTMAVGQKALQPHRTRRLVVLKP